jgi:hypothetical protein
MAKVTSEQWQAQQAGVWGDKDSEVFRRVTDRIRQQEDEVVAEVERMMRERVSAHAVVWYITNSILRGVDEVESSVPTMTCEEYAASEEVRQRDAAMVAPEPGQA